MVSNSAWSRCPRRERDGGGGGAWWESRSRARRVVGACVDFSRSSREWRRRQQTILYGVPTGNRPRLGWERESDKIGWKKAGRSGEGQPSWSTAAPLDSGRWAEALCAECTAAVVGASCNPPFTAASLGFSSVPSGQAEGSRYSAGEHCTCTMSGTPGPSMSEG